MDNKILNLTYASSLTDLCEINPSFDSGILRIAYPGANPNGSYISKETFERCVKSIYNCPIVCNYNRESDTLGGHDMEVVRDNDGELSLINMTTPLGCIPESSRIFWDEVTEDDGSVHEYLCAEALLWKRQEAYKKVKRDGIVAQSMEITVKDGEMIDGIYHIKDFIFTAFALIGVAPCFESASLETFSKQDFKAQLSEMMSELKNSFNLVKAPIGDDNIQTTNHLTKGGEQVLDKNELISQYGIDISTLDFSIDDFTVEELEERFKAIKNNIPKQEGTKDKFALMQNLVEEMNRALSVEKVWREWGECNRYWFVDCDLDICEIYCWDSEDWLLYGFTYTMNGDNVVIDFTSKKRMKYVITDFDEGDQASPIAAAFTQIEKAIQDNADQKATEWKGKYQAASENITSMENELKTLRKFKSDTEAALVQDERENIFAQFEDLSGVEAFEALKNNCTNLDIETLEEKCYAIRGRQGVAAKFELGTKPPKFDIQKEKHDNAPYGGLFEKYGISAEN